WVLEDGRVLNVANVIWCTGFTPGFSWIDLAVFEQSGEPKHAGGVVVGEPGLYFVGLQFLYALSSTMIHGVGRDAERIAEVIDTRIRATASRGADRLRAKRVGETSPKLATTAEGERTRESAALRQSETVANTSSAGTNSYRDLPA